jgi:hypothetical protein
LNPADLTFTSLDGLAFAAARGRLDTSAGRTQIVHDLGPFIELYQLSESGLLPRPDRGSWISMDGSASFFDALSVGRQEWLCPGFPSSGFFRTGTGKVDERSWIAFGIAAQRAAVSAGFKLSTAHQFVGALGELLDNIYEHSSRAASGLVAFKAQRDQFEFVVCDRGVGILESLRTCPEHAYLTDHGEALRLALTEGASRFGSNTNRGKGFRPLFLGLANSWGALRFRSGDHALVIDGRSPSLTTATTSQKAPICGFLTSVRCRAAM